MAKPPLSLVVPSIVPQGVQTPGFFRPSAADFSQVNNPSVELGRGLENLARPADDLGNLALATARVRNATAVKDQENQFLRETQDMMKGEKGYFKNTGIKAKEQFQPTYDAMLKLGEEYVGRASNDWQRRAMKEMVDGHITTYHGQMREWEDTQLKAWEINTQLGAAAVHGQIAATSPDDDKIISESADRVYTSTYAAMKLKGLPDDMAQAQAKSARSAVVATTIQLRLGKDPRAGLAYYEKYRESLDPQDVVRMDSAVTAARNQVQADDIIQRIMPNQARRETYQEMRAAGFSPNAAAALTGGAQAESGFSPTAINPNDAGPGLHSVGLIQWNRERLAGLNKFAEDNRLDVRDVSTQRKYVIHELTSEGGKYKAVGDKLKQGDITLEQAVRVVNGEYIVPAFTRQTGPASDAAWAKRTEFARDALVEENIKDDLGARDKSVERLQSVMQDPSIPQPVKDEVSARVSKMNSLENMRRITAIKEARDLEDATIQDGMSGKIPVTDVAAKLTEAANKALGANDRSEFRRLTALAGNAGNIINFANMPLTKQKEYLASLMQGTAQKVAAGQIAVDKERREQERAEAANKVEAFNKGVSDNLKPEAVAGLAGEAFNTFIRTQDWAKAIDIQARFKAWATANAAVMGRHDAVDRAMRQMEADLDANGASVQQVYLHKYMGDLIAKQEKEYKQDPYTYGERKLTALGAAPPVELNLSTPDPTLLATQLKARSQVAEQAEREEGRPIPPLRTAEIEQVWNKLETSDPATKQGILQLMGRNISGRQLELLAPLLSQKGQIGHAYYAAMLGYQRNDPYYTDISNRILRGADLLWKGGEAAKDVTTSDLVWKTTLNYKLGDVMAGMSPEKMNMLFTAVKALYVDGQGRLGGKYGEPVDDAKLSKAISEAVGDIDTINGQNIVLPRGYNRTDVLNGLRHGIPPEQLAGLRSQDGSQIMPSTLADRGVLHSIGDGKYTVSLPEGKGGSRMLKLVGDPTDRTRPWIIDIVPMIQRYNGGATFDPNLVPGAVP